MDDHPADTAPACPTCDRTMRLDRITPGSFSYPELKTFACRSCKEAVTVPEADE